MPRPLFGYTNVVMNGEQLFTRTKVVCRAASPDELECLSTSCGGNEEDDTQPLAAGKPTQVFSITWPHQTSLCCWGKAVV